MGDRRHSPSPVGRGLPILLLRKKGKLPGETISKTFTLKYGGDTIEKNRADVKAGMKILLVDDLIATSGTLKADAELVETAGAEVAGIFSVAGLPFLNCNGILADYEVKTLINYSSE